jgi:cytoskeletal protein CcmA (bactofilin family)
MSLPSVDAAVVDRHTTLTGSVSGHDLIVLGSLEGDLRLSGRLHVAAGSRLKARVQAIVVELDGEFEGELRAQTLHVAASARAKGVFVAERISIEEGALLEGSVQAPADATPAPLQDAGPLVPDDEAEPLAADEPDDSPAAAPPV